MIKFEVMWRTRTPDDEVFNFLSKCPHHSLQFYSWNVDSHFPCRTTWSNRKLFIVTGNNIFRQRSRTRRRCSCLRSLMPLVKREKIIVLHVRHVFYHIFLWYSAQLEQREITKFEVLVTTQENKC